MSWLGVIIIISSFVTSIQCINLEGKLCNILVHSFNCQCQFFYSIRIYFTMNYMVAPLGLTGYSKF